MTEEQFLEIQMEKFHNIAEDNKFETIWDLHHILNINEPSGFIGEIITDGVHHDIEVNLPNKELTWLELWKFADALHYKIGDYHHIFIENFELKEINGKKVIEVGFGS